MNEKYNHKEAYCLMMYKCEQCREVETLWNSRDGVTPFTIGCKKCEGLMQHVLWEKDFCRPDYLPRKGQRVFIDATPEINALYARVRVRLYWDLPECPMKEHYPDKIAAVEALIGTAGKGEPYTLTI